jgi:hypothetical protein
MNYLLFCLKRVRLQQLALAFAGAPYMLEEADASDDGWKNVDCLKDFSALLNVLVTDYLRIKHNL